MDLLKEERSAIITEKNNPISRRLFIFLIFYILAVVLATYHPIVTGHFISDDYWIIASAKEHGFSLKQFFRSIGQHFLPLYKIFITAEFKIFGVNPTGFYCMNIFLHLTNVLLVIILFSQLFKDRIIGLITGFIFGITASHWKVAMWITTQSIQMTTCCFLLSIILFIRFLERKRPHLLLFSALFHFLMFMSFTSGVEVPLCFFWLYIAFTYHEDPPQCISKKTFTYGLKIVIPFALNVIVFFILRQILFPKGLSLLKKGLIEGIIKNLPEALSFVCGGIYYGYVRSFINAYDKPFYYILIILGLMLLALNWSKEGIRKYWIYIPCFIFWIFFIYTPLASYRLSFGYSGFTSKSRYLYLPCVFAAAVFALLLRSFRFFSGPTSRINKILVIVTIFFFLWVASSNNRILTDELYSLKKMSVALKKSQQVFLNDLERLLRLKKDDLIQIVDKGIADNMAGWNVFPSLLVRIYLSKPDEKRIRFVPPDKQDEWDKDIPVYSFSDKGHIYQVHSVGE
ncbi:MAG: hypothetical protein ACETWK_11110 [Candidatus Aminicenantaceae bacterium]